MSPDLLLNLPKLSLDKPTGRKTAWFYKKCTVVTDPCEIRGEATRLLVAVALPRFALSVMGSFRALAPTASNPHFGHPALMAKVGGLRRCLLAKPSP